MQIDQAALNRYTLLSVLEVLESGGYDMQDLVNKVHIHAMTCPGDSKIAGIGASYKPAIVQTIQEATGLDPKHS